MPDTSSMSVGAMFFLAMTQTLFAFVGLEVATIPASAVQDPERTIPRATVVGTIATAIIYIVGTAGVMSLVAPDVLAKSTQPFADAAGVLGGARTGGHHRSRRRDLRVRRAQWLDPRRQPVPAGGRRDGLFPRCSRASTHAACL